MWLERAPNLNGGQVFQQSSYNSKTIEASVIPQSIFLIPNIQKIVDEALAKQKAIYDTEMEKLRKELQLQNIQKTQTLIPQTVEPGSEFDGINLATTKALGWKVDKPFKFAIKGNSEHIFEAIGYSDPILDILLLEGAWLIVSFVLVEATFILLVFFFQLFFFSDKENKHLQNSLDHLHEKNKHMQNDLDHLYKENKHMQLSINQIIPLTKQLNVSNLEDELEQISLKADSSSNDSKTGGNAVEKAKYTLHILILKSSEGYDYFSPEEIKEQIAYRIFNSAKYLGRKILAKDIHVYHQKSLYNHYTPREWAKKKSAQLQERLDVVAYIVVFILLQQQGYRVVHYSSWSYMLKCLSNPKYYHIDKRFWMNGNENFVRSLEYTRYKYKEAGKQYLCASLKIDYFNSKYIGIQGKLINIDFLDSKNNCEYVR
ncbi:hypothetical protein C2G38_2040651 [Gigaspora rosea]|uniref:Uncharacterized protein n=1 Tax=Gigaspora rosea TaxID=44941 RepID=A0A397V1Q6_9GLOM|nr:hypothetical protein C2G38_2040651 [Gigaspora rosea]